MGEDLGEGEPNNATETLTGRGILPTAARKHYIAGGVSSAHYTEIGRSIEVRLCVENKGLPIRFLCFQHPGSTSSHSMA